MNKLSKILLLVLALAVLILSVSLTASFSRTANIKDSCTKQILSSLRTLEERLDVAVAQGTYTEKDSEKMQFALGTLYSMSETAETLYSDSTIYSYGFYDLSKALSSFYAAQHNNDTVESILYDGIVSEQELKFLTTLHADIEAMIQPMLGEDGLNWQNSLKYDDLRPLLSDFLDKWGWWHNFSDAPYKLLTVE